MTTKERRRAVRAPAKLAMQIKLGGNVAGAESINVSANGVYFSTRTYIPALTKLEITLMLPDVEGSGKQKEVVCGGVVVRVDPDSPDTKGPFEVACYFTSISGRDREALESYILKQLAF